MLTIRLARIGKKKQAYYKLIVSEKSRDTHGAYLEALGSLNPHTNPPSLTANQERISYWLGQGATASAHVHNLLVGHKLIVADKVKVWKPKKKPAEESKPEAQATKPQAAAQAKPEAAAADQPTAPTAEVKAEPATDLSTAEAPKEAPAAEAKAATEPTQ